MAHLLDKTKAYLADKLDAIKKPEASVEDMTLHQVRREGATFHCVVSVHNPYDHDLPVCEVSYALKSAGRVVASGTMPDPGSFEGETTTKLEVPIVVPYDFLVSLVKDAGRDWDIDYEVKIGLTVDLPIVGNFTIPLSKNGEIKLPTLSTIF